MSRSSYIAFEKGEKEPSFTQAMKLAGLFGLTVDELMVGQRPNYDKYKEMIIAFLREAKRYEVTLRKTKLAKLLYLADFARFYKTNQSISGMAYRKIEYGPVPDAYFRVLEELEGDADISIKIETLEGKSMFSISETRASERNDFEKLNVEELGLISKVWEKWKDANTQEIVKFTHEQVPYKNTVRDQIIPYDLIMQEKEEYVY